MKRTLEIASGVGVLIISVLSAAAVVRMVDFYRQTNARVPLISVVSLALTSLAVLFSFVGAYILLSWFNKAK